MFERDTLPSSLPVKNSHSLTDRKTFKLFVDVNYIFISHKYLSNMQKIKKSKYCRNISTCHLHHVTQAEQFQLFVPPLHRLFPVRSLSRHFFSNKCHI